MPTDQPPRDDDPLEAEPFEPDDDVVMLLTAASSFEANIIAASLRGAGIPAQALTMLEDTYSALSLTTAQPGVPVMVRRDDALAAREHLAQVRTEADEVDWENVRVETPTQESDAEPPAPPLRGAKAAFLLLVLVVFLLAIWQIAARIF